MMFKVRRLHVIYAIIAITSFILLLSFVILLVAIGEDGAVTEELINLVTRIELTGGCILILMLVFTWIAKKGIRWQINGSSKFR